MYRVGDFVFFENLPSAPYQIRKIEELNRCPNGTVEAKVLCFLRRRDLPPALVEKADCHLQTILESSNDIQSLSAKEKTKIADRELFMTRQVDTVSATCIRGKCVVTQYLDESSLSSYISQEDVFFYSLIYDQATKTLNSEKGSIRIGAAFQADIPHCTTEDNAHSDEKMEVDLELPTREELLWSASASPLIVDQLNEYLVLSRALATLSRSVHLPSCLKQPDLVQTVTAASRDVTTEKALHVLSQSNYSVSSALSRMVHWNEEVMKTDGKNNKLCSLVLWRDEMELWSVKEGNLYEEGLETYGKCFRAIQENFLPWKNLKDIISYYYFWKTTEPYVGYRRRKSTATENRLRQVYIPNYNHQPNASILYPPTALKDSPIGCESCHSAQSPLWYAWGRPGAHFKLCESCWSYWKRYGALKARLALASVKGISNGSTNADYESALENGNRNGSASLAAGPLTESTLMTRCMTVDWCDAILPAHFPALVRHMTSVHLFAEEYSHMMAASCLQHTKPLGILLTKLASSRGTVENNTSVRNLSTTTSGGAEKVPTLLKSTAMLRLARSNIIPNLVTQQATENSSKYCFFRKIARKAGLIPMHKMPWENKAVLIKACLDTMSSITYEDANAVIQLRKYVRTKNNGDGLQRLYETSKSWQSLDVSSFANLTLDNVLEKCAEKCNESNVVASKLGNGEDSKGEGNNNQPEQIVNSSTEMLFTVANIGELRKEIGSSHIRALARKPTSSLGRENAASTVQSNIS